MKSKNQEQSAELAAEPAPAQVEVLTVIGCDDYAGRGGSYVFDAETGKRVPSSETQAMIAAELGGEQ